MGRVQPKLTESVKWGNGCWLGKRGPVAYVYSAPEYVQFGFFNGASLKDPKGLLHGEGKFVRHAKVHALSDIDEPAFAALLLGNVAEPAALQPFNSERARNGPMPATNVVAQSVLPSGFRMTVFAAEPQVHQPIAMATDPRGRLWVAENYTFSERLVGYHKELRDDIVVFEDADNDGRFDQRHVFWDDAERLTSVEIGLGGVWALPERLPSNAAAASTVMPNIGRRKARRSIKFAYLAKSDSRK